MEGKTHKSALSTNFHILECHKRKGTSQERHMWDLRMDDRFVLVQKRNDSIEGPQKVEAIKLSILWRRYNLEQKCWDESKRRRLVSWKLQLGIFNKRRELKKGGVLNKLVGSRVKLDGGPTWRTICILKRLLINTECLTRCLWGYIVFLSFYIACLHNQNKSGFFGEPTFIQPISTIWKVFKKPWLARKKPLLFWSCKQAVCKSRPNIPYLFKYNAHSYFLS